MPHCYRYVARTSTQIVLAILAPAALAQQGLGVDSTQAQVGVHTQAQEEGQAQALEVGVTPVLAEVILTSGIDPTQIAGEL